MFPDKPPCVLREPGALPVYFWVVGFSSLTAQEFFKQASHGNHVAPHTLGAMKPASHSSCCFSMFPSANFMSPTRWVVSILGQWVYLTNKQLQYMELINSLIYPVLSTVCPSIPITLGQESFPYQLLTRWRRDNENRATTEDWCKDHFYLKVDGQLEQLPG